MSIHADVKPIAIFGAGGFGMEVAMLIEQINAIGSKWNMIGFFDDNVEKGTLVNDYPVLGDQNDLNKWPNGLALAIAIGNPIIKHRIVENITHPKIYFPTLIHPSVTLGNSRFLQIGGGCVICAGCIITTNIIIGNHVLFNLSCTVGHESSIGDFSAFMPTCNISGEVSIGRATYWGTGAKINNRITVGDNTIIGAGAVVTSDLPPDVTAVGVPAKIIKQNK